MRSSAEPKGKRNSSLCPWRASHSKGTLQPARGTDVTHLGATGPCLGPGLCLAVAPAPKEEAGAARPHPGWKRLPSPRQEETPPSPAPFLFAAAFRGRSGKVQDEKHQGRAFTGCSQHWGATGAPCHPRATRNCGEVAFGGRFPQQQPAACRKHPGACCRGRPPRQGAGNRNVLSPSCPQPPLQ